MTLNQPQPPSLLLLLNRALIRQQQMGTPLVPLPVRNNEDEARPISTHPNTTTAELSTTARANSSISTTGPIALNRRLPSTAQEGGILCPPRASSDMASTWCNKTRKKDPKEENEKRRLRLQLVLKTLDEVENVLLLNDDTNQTTKGFLHDDVYYQTIKTKQLCKMIVVHCLISQPPCELVLKKNSSEDGFSFFVAVNGDSKKQKSHRSSSSLPF